MKIITYNCFGIPMLTPRLQSRLKNMAQEAAALEPDIIFFQEVFSPRHKRILSEGLERFSYHYLPLNGFLGTGGGLCCFSKFPLESAGFERFSSNGHWFDPSISDKIAEKGFMTMTSKGRYFYNIHLTCDYDDDYSPASPYYSIQKSQLAELARSINKVPLDTPTFIMGDLNIPPSAELFSNFLKETGSVDLTVSDNPSLMGLPGSMIGKDPLRQKLDYVLFRGRSLPPVTWEYVFKDPPWSDHLGILMQID